MSKAGAQLAAIFESVVDSRLPVRLTSHNASAILVSWDDWHAIEETMHRLSMPKLASKQSRRERVHA